MDIRFLGPRTVVACSDRLADLIEELGFWGSLRRIHHGAAFEPISVQFVYFGVFHVVSSRRGRRSTLKIQRNTCLFQSLTQFESFALRPRAARRHNFLLPAGPREDRQDLILKLLTVVNTPRPGLIHLNHLTGSRREKRSVKGGGVYDFTDC